MTSFYDYMQTDMGVSQRIAELANRCEEKLAPLFAEAEAVAGVNQLKVLKAMQDSRLSESHFGFASGYGYNDSGRECLESVYAKTFKAELALARPQIISGTHALTVALFGNLRSGDELLSAFGKPYDTLDSCIGLRPAKGSLAEHGVAYRQAELKNGRPDLKDIADHVGPKTKLVLFQRSRGYAWRDSFSPKELGEAIQAVKSVRKDVICMVDNCYGEFVTDTEPLEAGADLIAGSMIKNPGGGLAPVGGYIAGKAEYIENAASRLSSPGLGREVGPSLGLAQTLLQGFFLAPQVVCGALKSAMLAALMFDELGYETLPGPFAKRSDIVQAVKLKSAKAVLSFCSGIQKAAPVDSFVRPEPWAMPGYDDPVVMAAGAFVQGSSIELSADAPMREPYIAYFQGGLTWHHGRAGVVIAIDNMAKDNVLSDVSAAKGMAEV
jgi:cystathionine beta-lyase family protein involved in aluminum resistance